MKGGADVSDSTSPVGVRSDPNCASPLPGQDARLHENLGISPLCPAKFDVLKRNQLICIKGAALAVFDLDETLVEGTGEAVHDGPDARFAYAVRTALQLRKVVFNPGEWRQIWEDGKDGQGGFRDLTGRAEKQVLEDMASRANLAYGHFFAMSKPVTPAELRVLSDQFLAAFSPQYASQIREIEGVTSLVERIKSSQLLLALCTASSPEFVLALEAIRKKESDNRFGFLERFDIVVTNAEKRIGEHSYRKEPVARICEQAHTPADQCVMFGDSMSDIATAALNDLPLIVIRFHGTPQEQQAQSGKLQRLLAAARVNHPDLAGKTQVVIVGHYDQVVIDPHEEAGSRTSWSIGTRAELGL